MNYKRELQKIERHRTRYYPAMKFIMDLRAGGADLPVDITDSGETFILLELLDIGYIDPDALVVQRGISSITHVYYTGRYPLTPAGEAMLMHRRRGMMERLTALMNYLLRH